MRLMRRASYWLARPVTPRIRAIPLDMLAHELELALLRVLVQLPAVVRSGSRARPVLASQMGGQVVLDAASAVGRGADVEHALAIPEDIHAAPLVRRMLDGRRGERPFRAAHGHGGARQCNRRAVASTLGNAAFNNPGRKILTGVVTVATTRTSKAGDRRSGRSDPPRGSPASPSQERRASSPSACAG